MKWQSAAAAASDESPSTPTDQHHQKMTGNTERTPPLVLHPLAAAAAAAARWFAAHRRTCPPNPLHAAHPIASTLRFPTHPPSGERRGCRQGCHPGAPSLLGDTGAPNRRGPRGWVDPRLQARHGCACRVASEPRLGASEPRTGELHPSSSWLPLSTSRLGDGRGRQMVRGCERTKFTVLHSWRPGEEEGRAGGVLQEGGCCGHPWGTAVGGLMYNLPKMPPLPPATSPTSCRNSPLQRNLLLQDHPSSAQDPDLRASSTAVAGGMHCCMGPTSHGRDLRDSSTREAGNWGRKGAKEKKVSTSVKLHWRRNN